METNNQEYRISFFKPSNPQTTANRNMVLWLLLIWTLAVFGFHVVLKLIEEPTPEPVLITYQELSQTVYEGNASEAEMQAFASVPLQVLSKVFIAPEERIELQNALNWALFQIADDEEKDALNAEIENFMSIEEKTTDILAQDYQQAKIELMAVAAPVLGLSDRDVRTKILPLELNTEYPETMSEQNIAQLETVLNKYLIHNESVLTNIKVLGFPFHYFYSAVFLLILFVVLCWIYCVKTDALNKKYGIDD
jgi:putative solute:sodium symporter small subunit